MRWFMLPVSAAAHVATFLVTLIVPLATGVEAPAPWPAARTTDFIAATPAPPPPVLRTVSAMARNHAAPTVAPDHIGPRRSRTPRQDRCSTASIPESPSVLPMASRSMGSHRRRFCRLHRLHRRPATYRPGGVIREPRKLVDVAPIYPDIARAARVEGLVILEATIDERGFVIDARVLRSVPLLDAAALAALKQWRYTPTLLNGTRCAS